MNYLFHLIIHSKTVCFKLKSLPKVAVLALSSLPDGSFVRPLLPSDGTQRLLTTHSSRFTLHFGDLPAGFGGCDGGGAGGVHQRSPQHAGPVLLARSQIALPPGLEVVLALPYTARRNLITCFCLAEEL